MDSAIPTKLGQAPTDTPRTLASNRRRLGSLFASMTMGNTEGTTSSTTPSSSRESGTPSKTTKGGPASGWLSWLSPTKQVYTSGEAVGGDEARWRAEPKDDKSLDVDEQSLEGSINLELGGEAREGSKRRSKQESPLYRLPDELLIEILLRLPLSPSQITTLSLVSCRFQALSQAPQLWSHLFHSTSGFGFLPEFAHRVVASDVPPQGHWDGVERVSSTTEPPFESHSIPVHYPTLYRSRRALSRIIRCESPSGPPQLATLREHTDSVYCVHIATPWLITGSRDRSLRFWKLAELPLYPYQSVTTETRLVKTIDRAHDGSVLSVDFEMDDTGCNGVLVTGSSDMTACVWNVDVENGGQVEIKKVATLRGHTGGVLGVALSRTRIATGSKDHSIRIYDRTTHAHLFTFDEHEGPVNCLALGPLANNPSEQVVSASGDGAWIIWDIITGKEIRRGAGDGRGLACVIWEGDKIITGDNDRLVKLFSAVDSTLLKTFEGHTDLVRSVAMDKQHKMIVSGSYDQSVRMWDVKSGNMIRRIRGNHSSLIFGVATDRGRVVSVSHDSTIQVYTYGQSLPYRGLFA